MPKQKQITAEEAYARIKKGIAERRYLPGQHLVEADLVNALRCSRGTVRNILQKLANEGVVEHFKNKGMIVKMLTQDEVLDIVVIIQALASRAVHLVAERKRQGDADILRCALEKCANALQTDTAEHAANRINDFMLEIAELSHNRQIIKLLGEYYTALKINYDLSITWREIHFERAKKAIRIYEEILKAIEAGDAEKASRICYDYFQEGIDLTVRGENVP